jgi:hypothetical protein
MWEYGCINLTIDAAVFYSWNGSFDHGFLPPPLYPSGGFLRCPTEAKPEEARLCLFLYI